MARTEVVSFDTEALILVDSMDQIVGHEMKGPCHDGQGILHRAFSIFIFNEKGEVLLQQRTSNKRLWADFWANTCCSHPRKDELTPEAAQRRLWEEVGIRASLNHVYKFEYHAHFGAQGSEYELCHVFIGGISSDTPFEVNDTEIALTEWIHVSDLDREMETDSKRFTPWLKLEWNDLRTKYWSQVEHLLP